MRIRGHPLRRGVAATASAAPLASSASIPNNLPTQLTSFIGREQEMRFLTSTLESIESQGTAVVELAGPAGIGKSRLIRELAAINPDMAFFEASAEQYASSTPYFVFGLLLRALLRRTTDQPDADDADVLERCVGELAPDLVPWLPLIALVMDVHVPPTPATDELELRFRRGRLHEVVAALLARLLPGPSLLVFDDAHWFDAASRELLRFIVENVRASSWLICISSAVEIAPSYADLAPNGATLQLEPLSPDASIALTSAAAGEAAIPQYELNALAERAGGNPLSCERSSPTGSPSEKPGTCRRASSRCSRRASTGLRRMTGGCCGSLLSWVRCWMSKR